MNEWVRVSLRIAVASTTIALSLVTATLNAQDSTRALAVQFGTCDSVSLKQMQLLAVGEGFQPYVIAKPDGRCSTTVYVKDGFGCLSRMARGCASLVYDEGPDTLYFWFYSKCDTAEERSQLCWVVPAGNADFRVAMLRRRESVIELLQDIDLDSLVFPAGSHQSGHNRPNVGSFEFIPIDKQNSQGVMALTIEDNSMGNHPHSDQRTGYWWLRGDSLNWIGSLWRGIYTVSGARSSRGFNADPKTRGMFPDRIELEYHRSFRAEEDLWFGKLEDQFPLVLQIEEKAIRPIGYKIGNDSVVFLRNSFPMLVGHRNYVDNSDPACPADIAVVPLFSQTGFGEPLLGPYSLAGRMSYSLRESLKGPITPTVNGWIEGDSLALSFCMPDERKVAFWFDPDVRWDFYDTIISGEERVYIVHPHERSSPFRVEGYRVYRGPNGMAFELVDSGGGQFRWFNTGLEVTIRISRSQIGFQTVDSLALCGFAMQALWWEGDTPGESNHDFERAPDGFNRDKPSTWGNLAIGRRVDMVDERGLWRHLELLESRKRQ